MAKRPSDHSSRILSLSQEIRELSVELDHLLTHQASRSSFSALVSPSPPGSSSIPPTAQVPITYESFLVGDIVRITNRYGG